MKIAALSTTKKYNAIKSIHQISELFNAKQKSAVHKLGYSQTKRKSTSKGNPFWSTIQQWKGDTKINARVKQYLYYWII